MPDLPTPEELKAWREKWVDDTLKHRQELARQAEEATEQRKEQARSNERISGRNRKKGNK
jgi:hypothetical protein